MLKNKSYFKKSLGDEAGCAPKKGVVTSVNMGKVYFNSWSMDVKIEGENVVRNLDMTTHNHACKPANGAVPTVHVALAGGAGWDDTNCKDEIEAEKEACQEFDPYKKGKSVCSAAGMTKGVRSLSDTQHKNNAIAVQSAPAPKDAKTPREKALGCLRARRCRLVPYKPKDKKGTKGCCPSQTPDHLLPKASFKKTKKSKLTGWKKYKSNKAPCMCAEGPSNTGQASHPLRHTHHKVFPPKGVAPGQLMPFDDAIDHSAAGAAKVFKGSGCTKKCIQGQLDAQHREMAADKQNPADVKYVPSGSTQTKSAVNQKVVKLNQGAP
jgi:hypothetical protein